MPPTTSPTASPPSGRTSKRSSYPSQACADNAAALGAAAPSLRLALPKGRMQQGVLALLAEAGIDVRMSSRGYRPEVSLPGVETKVLKPQNILEMLAQGTRDVGFAGADWVQELGVDVVELLDTGLDAVRLAAAAPASLLEDGRLPRRKLVVASEFENLTTQWIADRGLDADFVRTYGATEVFPPEDADCIVDIAASGDTLRSNNLVIVEELCRSSTRLYASTAAMKDPARAAAIERIVMLVKAALDARKRVMIELNVSTESLESVVGILPCMREATVAPLHRGGGFAVKAAVPRDTLPTLIPEIKARGGSDIVVTGLNLIVA